MTAPAPRPSEREIAHNIAERFADDGYVYDCTDAIESALTEARRAAIEDCMQKADRVATAHWAHFDVMGREREIKSENDALHYGRAQGAELVIAAIARSLTSPSPGKGGGG